MPFITEDGKRYFNCASAEAWAKSYLGPHGCEPPNLRKGDVVHLQAKFLRPSDFAPTTWGVFDIGGLVQFSPYSAIVDVELPLLAIGDHVVTPDGRRGIVIGFRRDEAHISLGNNGWGEHTMAFCNVDTLRHRLKE